MSLITVTAENGKAGCANPIPMADPQGQAEEFGMLDCTEASSRTMGKMGKLGEWLLTARERFGAQNAFTSYLTLLSEVTKKLGSPVRSS